MNIFEFKVITVHLFGVSMLIFVHLHFSCSPYKLFFLIPCCLVKDPRKTK